MIFICLNFIFFYTGPKSVKSCWTPEHGAAHRVMDLFWHKKGLQLLVNRSEIHVVWLLPFTAGTWWKAGQFVHMRQLCTPVFICSYSPVFRSHLLHTLQHFQLKIAQWVSILCWHKPNFTPPFSSFPCSYTSYPLKQSTTALKLPET